MPRGFVLLLGKKSSAVPPPTGGNGGGGPPVAGALSRAQMVDFCSRYWPADQVEHALAVSQCESGWRPSAHCLNCVPGVAEDSRGLFQINVNAWTNLAGFDLFNPDTNCRWAEYIWRVSGQSWHTWACGQELGLA